MLTIPWYSPLGIAILLAWLGSPVIAFAISFLWERRLCRKEKRGRIHAQPVLAGITASLPAVWFMMMLENVEVMLLVLLGGVAVSFAGSFLAHLKYCDKSK